MQILHAVIDWFARLRTALSGPETTGGNGPAEPAPAKLVVAAGAEPIALDLDHPTGAPLTLTAASRTNVGNVRQINEDSLLDGSERRLWVVADGVGGHQAGDYASQNLVAALDGLPQDGMLGKRVRAIRTAVDGVHRHLGDLAKDRGDQIIGTTLVALLVDNSRYACLWVGDSRLYLHRGGRLQRLTRDHSLVQDLVDRGVLTPEAAEHHPQANVLLAAVGAGEGLKLDLVTGPLQPGDLLLLCTDGLTRDLPEEQIRLLLEQGDLGTMADRLMRASLDAGGKDNVSLILVRCSAAQAADDAGVSPAPYGIEQERTLGTME